MMVRVSFSFLCLFLCSACGRYSAPQPPEYFAPRSVNSLQVSSSIEGVNLSWIAPERDLLGKPLKSIDGYYIYRREIILPTDIQRLDVDDELITTLSDNHLFVLRKLREEAIEKGMISRKVEVDKSLMTFSFIDKNVKPGNTYLYTVVPYNQGDVKGGTRSRALVNFRGDASTVSYIESSDSEVKKVTRQRQQKKFSF